MENFDPMQLLTLALLGFVAAGSFLFVGASLRWLSYALPGDDDIADALPPDLGLPEAAQEVDQEAHQFLERIAVETPFPAWVEDGDGRVIWANPVYAALAAEQHGASQGQVPLLFDQRRSEGEDDRPVRQALTRPDGSRTWYDVLDRRAETGERIRFATPADSLVRAEDALRNFVQTLTKTFAHLPIGLAVFDKDRKLAIFNPALADLTGLPPDWLTGRPSIFSFLDRLRNASMTPEPRDFSSWRARIAEMMQEAETGIYEENWSLPSGQTYRVTGRPHPDGAIALVFEDITTAVTLKRKFRSEIAFSQSVLDNIEDGIAVLDRAGRLVLGNEVFTRLWGVSAEDTLSEIPLLDLLDVFRSRSRPTPVWGELRDFALVASERAQWDASVEHRDGDIIDCRFTPLPGRSTMCRFRVLMTDDKGNLTEAQQSDADTPVDP